MKLITAIPAFLLAALTPSVAGQDLLGFVGITDSNGATISWPASSTCFDYPGGRLIHQCSPTGQHAPNPNPLYFLLDCELRRRSNHLEHGPPYFHAAVGSRELEL
ncbi:hypothetical protein ASPCAL05822 [Aspergillus calidoustus]|uniref:Uncharacterized protein n=1 Tax=Aspergillus calidoustus TaxID=454130 RepID=A0A0U5G2Q4_ASPCI|nr:hypothetical protein ASPCAL05822 [Aspergillus calidoustus]